MLRQDRRHGSSLRTDDDEGCRPEDRPAIDLLSTLCVIDLVSDTRSMRPMGHRSESVDGGFAEIGPGEGAELVAIERPFTAAVDLLLEARTRLALARAPQGPRAMLPRALVHLGDDIDDVIPRAEIEDFMSLYKSAAGFSIETLNAAPPTVAPDARMPGVGR